MSGPTDAEVENVLAWYGPYVGTPPAPDPHEEVIAAVAREVLASRKLIADLRATLDLTDTVCVRHNEAQCDCCTSVHRARRLIEEHES